MEGGRRRWRSGATYNVMFPLWLLIWLPTWLWLGLVPLNYLIDRAVLWLSLPASADRRGLCRRFAWRCCLCGFAADFVGSALLLAATLGLDALGGEAAFAVNDALAFDPFSNGFGLLVTCAAIAVSGLLIWLLDRRVLRAAGLDEAQLRRSAGMLALITAPYLFLLPSRLLYGF